MGTTAAICTNPFAGTSLRSTSQASRPPTNTEPIVAPVVATTVFQIASRALADPSTA
jgi:hypothetical protein